MISAASTGDEVAFSTASAQIEASRPPGPQWLPAPAHAPPTSSATSSLSRKITASATLLILISLYIDLWRRLWHASCVAMALSTRCIPLLEVGVLVGDLVVSNLFLGLFSGWL